MGEPTVTSERTMQSILGPNQRMPFHTPNRPFTSAHAIPQSNSPFHISACHSTIQTALPHQRFLFHSRLCLHAHTTQTGGTADRRKRRSRSCMCRQGGLHAGTSRKRRRRRLGFRRALETGSTSSACPASRPVWAAKFRGFSHFAGERVRNYIPGPLHHFERMLKRM